MSDSLLDRVAFTLRSDKPTVGDNITWDNNRVVSGNQRRSDPQLSQLYIDDCGRIWCERPLELGTEGRELRCVLDTRKKP